MIRLFGRPNVADELRRRGIGLLLHSTHVYRNLPQIFADGTLCTARALWDRYGAEAARYLHDPRRYEKFTVGTDYLNASLTVPNVELLYRRSKSEWTADWIHFALDLSLLSRDTTLFTSVSAAANLGRDLTGGAAGLRAMFDVKVGEHSRDHLPHNVPTHPQAEVLIRGSLSLSEVRKIIVPDERLAAEVQRMMEARGLAIKIAISPQLFAWPAWLVKS